MQKVWSFFATKEGTQNLYIAKLMLQKGWPILPHERQRLEICNYKGDIARGLVNFATKKEVQQNLYNKESMYQQIRYTIWMSLVSNKTKVEPAEKPLALPGPFTGIKKHI